MTHLFAGIRLHVSGLFQNRDWSALGQLCTLCCAGALYSVQGHPVLCRGTLFCAGAPWAVQGHSVLFCAGGSTNWLSKNWRLQNPDVGDCHKSLEGGSIFSFPKKVKVHQKSLFVKMRNSRQRHLILIALFRSEVYRRDQGYSAE